MTNTLTHADAFRYLQTLPDNCADCIITSPPYFGKRDYGVDGQLGQEDNPLAYIVHLSAIFRHAKRVLKPTGTFWLNLGDSYSLQGKQGGSTSGKARKELHGKREAKKIDYGRPAKSLLMIPARVAIALQDDGWLLRSEIIWRKTNGMSESAKDRPTSSTERIYLFAKSSRYFWNFSEAQVPAKPASIARLRRGISDNHKHRNGVDGQKAHTFHAAKPNDPEREVSETANIRDVWDFPVGHYEGAHYATMPLILAERMVMLGCPRGGVVLDPFMGAGTTAVAAKKNGRNYLGCDLNLDYLQQAESRLKSIVQSSLLDVVGV